MTTLCLADYSEPISITSHPRVKIETAMREFCHRHGIPAQQTHDAILLALAHYERGHSEAAAIENGKTHVRFWIETNSPEPAA